MFFCWLIFVRVWVTWHTWTTLFWQQQKTKSWWFVAYIDFSSINSKHDCFYEEKQKFFCLLNGHWRWRTIRIFFPDSIENKNNTKRNRKSIELINFRLNLYDDNDGCGKNIKSLFVLFNYRFLSISVRSLIRMTLINWCSCTNAFLWRIFVQHDIWNQPETIILGQYKKGN